MLPIWKKGVFMSKDTHSAEQSPEQSMNPEKRLSAKEVASLLGIGLSTLWKWLGEGRIPQPERYGARCTRWRFGTLIDHLNSKD